ncbi:MAG: PAS domain S-box protein [Desulfobacteraceae bacterium]|nr:MAG: PAS domain S-box protein [Desulfobacteraceae bacterium]
MMAAQSIANGPGGLGTGSHPTNTTSQTSKKIQADLFVPDQVTLLLDAMGESYFETDLSGKLTHFNDFICRFHGRTREELMELDYRTYTRPGEAQKVCNVFNEVFRSGVPSGLFDFEIIRKDGTPANTETVVSLRRAQNGQPIGFSGISRDITEMKKMEQALRQSEEKHRSIIANMEEGYYEVDLKGTFTFVNAATCRNFGRDCDELIGMNYRDYMPPSSAAEAYRVYNEVYRSGIPAGIFRCALIRKDGSMRIHETSISPLRQSSGKIVGFFGISRDLTERLQMETALRESEQSYRGIMDLSPDTITINRADDGRYVQVNRAFCRKTGCTPEEAIGRTPLELNLFADPTGCKQLVEALQQGPVDGLELQFRAKDGTIFDDLVSARPIEFKGEACYLTVATIITPLKLAHQALRESEESYRRLIELAPDAITVSHLNDGKYFEVNEVFCQQTGFSREEVIGRTVADLKIYENPKGRIRFTEILRKAGRVDGMEIRFRAKSGASLVNLVSARIIQFKGEQCVLAVGTLINELKMAQQALQEREEGYRTILETAPYSITLVRLSDSVHVQVNDAFCRNTGFSREETIGRTHRDLNIYADPIDRDRLTQALRRQGRVDGMEIRFRAKDGHFFETLVSVHPIRYKGDDCLVNMVVDITERKRAERELDQYRRHLEEMIKARTLELEDAQSELIKREKLAVLGQLTATVSHELRNPLGVIRSSNFYLQRRVKEKDAKVDKHFKRIEEQVALCDAIVADLLEYTRGRNVSIATEDLAPWLEALAAQLRENEGIGIELHLDKTLPPVPHDREKLRRAVLNVLDNACQAVRARQRTGGSDVDYKPRIVVATQTREKDVVIEICDNGIGMSQETLQRAFEPLFTTRARGTGIGLANVKKIVEEHGGNVILESRLGEGTQMTITLPCGRQSPV